MDYHFVSDEEFERMRGAGEFLESADVFGKKYGTPRAWVEEQLRRGRLVILEIDVKGAAQVKAKRPDAYGIFVLPPDEATLLERLRSRRREGEDVIRRRFAEAQREIADARTSGAYDAFLVNSDLDAAVAEAVGLVAAERRRRSTPFTPRSGT